MAQFRKDKHEYLPDGKTIFEVVQIADQYGNLVGAANPSGMAVDAFGRARSSQPFTIFESFHRFQDNGRIGTANTAGGTYQWNANTCMIEMTVDSTADAEVKRETNRVFAYQPGKSLQILLTFCMNAPKTGLRQRAGYYGDDNGFFLEQDGTTISFVRRSKVTGSVVDTKVNQADCNIDKLDGTGPSRLTLDLTKSQILFVDIEWLGVGSVRMGFVINGQFIHCHSFHHANVISTTYMQTACLPGRIEIKNTGGMTGTATYRQACFAVISEGGYTVSGRARTVSMSPSTPKDLAVANTIYPIISMRLKDARKDAIVIPTSAEFFGITNNVNYRWFIITGATLTGASWVDAGDGSSVEYDVSATAFATPGIQREMGYVNVAAGAGAAPADLRGGDFFRYQLERNPFAPSDNGIIFTLAASSPSAGADAVGGLRWEEFT